MISEKMIWENEEIYQKENMWRSLSYVLRGKHQLYVSKKRNVSTVAKVMKKENEMSRKGRRNHEIFWNGEKNIERENIYMIEEKWNHMKNVREGRKMI